MDNEPTGRLPAINEPLPSFELPAVKPRDEGLEHFVFTPESYLDSPLVLFFYPKDDTPGCTIEVCGFRDFYAEFRRRGAAIVGVSRDSLSSHEKFITGQQLPYALASDDGAALIRSWGLLVNKTMYGKPVTGVARTTLLVDKTGRLREVFEKVSPQGHAEEVLRGIDGLQGG